MAKSRKWSRWYRGRIFTSRSEYSPSSGLFRSYARIDQAYPYQKFGSYEGRVASVSRSALAPAELPQQLTGLTGLYDGNAPIYRITVALARQDVTAYGKPVPLHPGMQLEADVLVETRRLIEWVFDPLYTLTGRWQR